MERVMREQMDHELRDEMQELKRQLARLQLEHAKTRNGWINWMRATGLLLVMFGASFLVGVLSSKHPSTAIGTTFAIMAVVMLVLGAWSLAWSLRPIAERMMNAGLAQIGEIR
jgi:Na+/melibiose symporter-like transporter